MSASRATGTGAVLMLGAAAAWILAVRQMGGMDMGVATELGPFEFFVGARDSTSGSTASGRASA